MSHCDWWVFRLRIPLPLHIIATTLYCIHPFLLQTAVFLILFDTSYLCRFQIISALAFIAYVHGAGHHTPGYSYSTYHHAPPPSHHAPAAPLASYAAHAPQPILIKAAYPAVAVQSAPSVESHSKIASSYASYSSEAEAKAPAIAAEPAYQSSHYAIQPAKIAYAPIKVAYKVPVEAHSAPSFASAALHAAPAVHYSSAGSSGGSGYSEEGHGADYYVSNSFFTSTPNGCILCQHIRTDTKPSLFLLII